MSLSAKSWSHNIHPIFLILCQYFWLLTGDWRLSPPSSGVPLHWLSLSAETWPGFHENGGNKTPKASKKVDMGRECPLPSKFWIFSTEMLYFGAFAKKFESTSSALYKNINKRMFVFFSLFLFLLATFHGKIKISILKLRKVFFQPWRGHSSTWSCDNEPVYQTAETRDNWHESTAEIQHRITTQFGRPLTADMARVPLKFGVGDANARCSPHILSSFKVSRIR